MGAGASADGAGVCFESAPFSQFIAPSKSASTVRFRGHGRDKPAFSMRKGVSERERDVIDA